MIQHHPEDYLAAASFVLPQGGPENTPDDYRRVAAAWERALSEHSANADVLFNAGVFLQSSDAKRSLELFQEARRLDASPESERCVTWSAHVYAAAITMDTKARSKVIDLSPEFALQLRNQIESSTDAALLSAVGVQLIRTSSHPGHTLEPIRDMGFDLLQRAVDLDPTNPRWKEALESAKWEPVRQQNLEEIMHAVPSGELQIGAKVAEANLITKVDPQYPPLALAARIQGTVEFTVTIGPEGRVQKTQLVRGHPLLVQAAAAALQQWVYRPTLLNGRPVSVLTTVAVPFRLPQ